MLYHSQLSLFAHSAGLGSVTVSYSGSDDLRGFLIVESVTVLLSDADCFTSLYLLCSTSYLLFPEIDWLILLLKLLWLIYLQETLLQYLHIDCTMVVTHLDCCLCCTILMTTEIIRAITATANNVDKATITPLLSSLKLSPSEQLQVTTEKATVANR